MTDELLDYYTRRRAQHRADRAVDAPSLDRQAAHDATNNGEYLGDHRADTHNPAN